jgi:hypothetical protein
MTVSRVTTWSAGNTLTATALNGEFDNVLTNLNLALTPTPTGALTARSLSARFADIVNVKDFGAVGDGTTDDTTAIQAAITAGGQHSKIWLPSGTYKVTSTLTITNDRVHFFGSGMWATQILFAPTANDTCIEISDGANIIYQGSISDLTFYSNDSTYTKVALEISDASGYRAENIAIGGGVVVGSSTFWSGNSATSIGLRTKGREFCQIKNLYNYADKPVVIAGNPNSILDIDHFHFQNLYLAANANPCVTIDDGVNLSNVEFDGANPWVLGTYGLYWSDTTTSAISNNLRIRGVRTEQGEDATAHSIYISHNFALQGLDVESCYLDTARKGVYLRKVSYADLTTVIYGGTLEAFNATALAGFNLSFRNCFWQQSSTATLTDYMMYDGIPDDLSSKPIPNTAHYVYGGGTIDPTGVRRRLPIVATASLPAAAAAMDGTILIENGGAGDRNLIIYAGGQRFRIDGGGNV